MTLAANDWITNEGQVVELPWPFYVPFEARIVRLRRRETVLRAALAHLAYHLDSIFGPGSVSS